MVDAAVNTTIVDANARIAAGLMAALEREQADWYRPDLDFSNWLELNDDVLYAKAMESGCYGELDFNREDYDERQYERMLQDCAKNPGLVRQRPQ